ncbi:hypothetical protein LU196_07910 [Pantoea sp. Mb-10]|uniref:hypothetical protein n=1 Tax=unclassified Pantoea TaxID=2630326 RepID=UPI001E4F88A8|nr:MULTISPECIES: hypothetical protein [unclassified Pantoea]MCE0489976.1 hypothetical protein [Pantoea sp. Mb-10]MCE0500917.1 hypothetical protein [Pantoea sp. Pb-8]
MDPHQLFEHCIARTAIDVPPAWRAGTLQCVIELRQAVAQIDACRVAHAEPANGFFPEAVVYHYEATRE